VTGDGEVRSPLPLLMKFSVEPMLRSSSATRFGGSRLPLETIGEGWTGRRQHDGGHPIRQSRLPGPGTIPLQIGHGRIYESYAVIAAVSVASCPRARRCAVTPDAAAGATPDAP
jgi:hypothetical protein